MLLVSLLLQMSLFLTLTLIQEVSIPVHIKSPLDALCSVKEVSFIFGLNFEQAA